MTVSATLLIRGGPILTQDRYRPQARALALREGRVLALDEAAEAAADAGTAVVDLHDAALLPGFIDAHTHLVDYGAWLAYLDLSLAPSLGAALERVARAAAGRAPGRWLIARGWDESRWPEARPPSRAELDQAVPAAPVLLMRVDMHLGVLNRAGLAALGYDPADVPDGMLTEAAVAGAYASAGPDPEAREAALAEAIGACHARGVTAVHTTLAGGELHVLRRARAAGRLGVRTTAYVWDGAPERAGLSGPEVDPWLRVAGVKLFADGSVGAHTAAFTHDYADAPGRGELLYSVEALAGRLRAAADQGLQPAIHCIGDAAVAATLEALARARVPPELRPRLEHMEFWSDRALEAMRRQGVVASCQPNFIGQWGQPGGLYEQRRGRPCGGRHNAYRRLLEGRVPLAFGSDHMPFGPLYGLHWAVNHPDPAQRLTVDEALYAYTAGAAYAAGQEDVHGVLRPGAPADLVVLDEDPRRRPAQLDARTVLATLCDGQTVYDPGARFSGGAAA